MSNTSNDKVKDIFEDMYQSLGLLKAITDKGKLLDALRLRLEMLEDRIYDYNRCGYCLRRLSKWSEIYTCEVTVKVDNTVKILKSLILCSQCARNLLNSMKRELESYDRDLRKEYEKLLKD